ncbi:MAG: BrnA antitoxin family protein [Coriobacteriales bacterium]|jgi:predicted DNA binding CopG/RHH family protein|nr:BrnA antitoxin family protein [Coriobacteriales bacterium]
MENDEMRAEHDFSDSKPNPYAKRLKQQVTMRIDTSSLNYFKEQAAEIGLPYQSLINLYLADCVANRRKLTFA